MTRALSLACLAILTIGTLGSRAWAGKPSIAVLGLEVVDQSGTPTPAVSILSSALARAARSPKVAARFQADGIETPAGGPEELGRLIARELQLWSRVVREAKITVSD
mgnify:CR=1 FL=1